MNILSFRKTNPRESEVARLESAIVNLIERLEVVLTEIKQDIAELKAKVG